MQDILIEITKTIQTERIIGQESAKDNKQATPNRNNERSNNKNIPRCQRNG
jgi:hypothetical protein